MGDFNTILFVCIDMPCKQKSQEKIQSHYHLILEEMDLTDTKHSTNRRLSAVHDTFSIISHILGQKNKP